MAIRVRVERVLCALVTLATVSVSEASAGPYDGCFERTYDSAHLDAHKGQNVTFAKLKLKPRNMDDGYNVAVELRFGFRDGKDDYYAVGICQERSDHLYCGLDQDAGQISIKQADDGVLLSPLSDVRVDSASGSEEDFMTIDVANIENRTFKIERAAGDACREFDDNE